MQPENEGKLLGNLLLFGQALRRLGIRVGAQQIYELAQGLAAIDISDREDFYYATRCFLVHNVDELDLFKYAFDLFWSGHIDLLVEMGASQQNAAAREDRAENPEGGREIVKGRKAELEPTEGIGDRDNVELAGTYSPIEHLYQKDFSEFSDREMELARKIVRDMIFKLDERATRRQVHASKRANYLDLSRSIRNGMKQGGELVELSWRKRKMKPRPLVVICDISGSMEQYSRLFLHLMYALVQGSRHIETFVFGTRLTWITPALRYRDLDSALDKMSELVLDWSGGTRIGESLRAFNYRWSRRVLGRSAVVIIISDGWDRGDIDTLDQEIQRLRRSVSRLIWLNPLIGHPGYQPLVRGIQTILPHVDDFLPLHNLQSLEDLVRRLGRSSFHSRTRRNRLNL
jgi:uncharacterized protein with von Willebrand factor type A (vWA) domain